MVGSTMGELGREGDGSGGGREVVLVVSCVTDRVVSTAVCSIGEEEVGIAGIVVLLEPAGGVVLVDSGKV